MQYKKQKFTDGLAWGEGLRWRDGYLYFSDIYGKKVYRADAKGRKELLMELADMPSGLGFLSDGSLLIVSGGEKQVLRYDNGKIGVYADLSALCVGLNDMVVDSRGNVYVGAYGFEIQHYKGGAADGWVFHISPSGEIHKVCNGLKAPNGMIVTPDEKQLIVADTFASRLVVYELDENGKPSEGKDWATLPAGPDGICYDNQGAVWAALPNLGKVARIEKGGNFTDEITFEHTPLCCALGGENRKTLFVVTVPAHNELSNEDLSNPEKQRNKAASVIETVKVKISGVGYP